jgi:membrane-bound serine protease (ClpP class)
VKVDGAPWVLEVVGAEERPIEMDLLTRLFNFLASPDVAVLLALAGMLGLYIEFNQPGMLVPGIVGAICLVLAAIAFQILPFSWVGLLIMLLGLGLIVAEIFVTSFGLLFAGGLACLLLGGSMLFDLPEYSDLTVSFWSVLVPLVVAFAFFAGLVILLVGRAMLRGQTAGVDELIGLVGKAATDLSPDGRVFVRGEYWNSRADEMIEKGQSVEVLEVEGMRLRVRRAGSD